MVAEKLRTWLKENKNKAEVRGDFRDGETEIVLISDSTWGGDRREAFKTPEKEKEMRAQLISAVERALGRKTVVIVDGLNNIGGIRYQLYSQAKARSTPHCVVYVDSERGRSMQENSKREGSMRYPDDVLKRLIDRFEEPHCFNSWDNPLFYASAGRGAEYEKIARHLFCSLEQKPSVANSSLQLGVDLTYVQRAERSISEILAEIIESLESESWCHDVPLEIELRCSPVPVRFSRSIPTKAELCRCRTKFSSIIRVRTEGDDSKLRESFVEFVNSYFD